MDGLTFQFGSNSVTRQTPSVLPLTVAFPRSGESQADTELLPETSIGNYTEAVLPSSDESFRQLTSKLQQAEIEESRDRQDNIFDVLSSFYSIGNPATVQRFLTEHRNLRSILFRALPKIVDNFGRNVKAELRLIDDMEDDLQRVRVSILSDNQDAREALERFDEAWWLDNVQSTEGLLDFALRRE
jgi:hypothetical protein